MYVVLINKLLFSTANEVKEGLRSRGVKDDKTMPAKGIEKHTSAILTSFKSTTKHNCTQLTRLYNPRL